MANDPLDLEGRALWRRVEETVRPLRGRRVVKRSPAIVETQGAAGMKGKQGPAQSDSTKAASPTPSPKREGARKHASIADTLDGGWDKRLQRGLTAPDVTIDLHGHTLTAAHAALEEGLRQAVARQARLILLVTGKPPPPGRSRLDNPLRGVIRASVGDWLHHSRHAAHIAAVRNAHPKHGGAGALYVILRRVR